MSADRTVVHYGPAPGTHGGMASVLETYLGLELDGSRTEVAPTWAPDARLWGAGHVARAVAGLRRGERRRAVAHVHLSERGSFVREGGVVALASLLGGDVVVSLHGADFPTFAPRHRRLVTTVLRRADVVCALGPRTADFVRDLVPGARVEVVPNPVAVPSRATSAAGTPEVVLFAGEIGARKGVDVLLAAWPKVRAERPDAVLLIAGPPGDVEPVDVPGVEWLGLVPRAEVADRIEHARVAVLPSRAEQLPMFLLEAMARARPVVATDVAELAWLAGAGGTVVPAGDADALAQALVRYLAQPEEAAAAGAAARARVEAEFSTAAVARRLAAVYRSLDDPGRTRRAGRAGRAGRWSRWSRRGCP